MMKTIGYIFIAVSIFLGGRSNTYAQNGESLFKTRCNTCHLIDKNSVGPWLKGVKQKWNEAGEGELLYDWVHNPSALILSGKSKLANEVKNFSPTEMTPQDVSNTEIDAILDYVDSYTPVTPNDTTGVNSSVHGNVTPDYEQNINIFYGLLCVILVLLIGIWVVSGSISTLVKSDFFKERIKNLDEQSLKSLLVIVSLGLMFFNNNAAAMSIAGPAEETPWLKVEKTDIYILLGIIGVLIWVLFYLKRMFRNFMNMAVPPKEKPVKEAIGRKINKVLTDVVPIEEEEKILMHHEYDGIRELDNNLPPWWVWGFYATIVFSIIYILNYHVLKTSDLQLEAYNKDIKQSEADVKAYREKMAMNVDENSATLMTSGTDLSAGKALFDMNCVACHSDKGEGKIGPNLTDKSWIYGPDIKVVFKTVKNGTANGMPEHNSKFNPVQIQQVASYILSLPETIGKEPEGEIIEE